MANKKATKKTVKTTDDPRAAALAAIEKAFGKGSIMRLDTDSETLGQYEIIPTGSMKLDKALGIGGYPRGRIVEVYGPESSGKTTLALHAVAEAQKQGIRCAFVDVEHSLDVGYAQKLGVDLDKIDISQPDYGEQALEIVIMLCQSGAYGLIVIDSVSALTPKAELEGNMEDNHVGLQARMMGQALRKLAGPASKSNTTIFFINQIRMKIGVMFGSPETTSGGNALKFYASQRLDIRRIGGVKDGGENATFHSNRTRVTVKKNKTAPPFKQAEFNIKFGVGIDRYDELIEVGVDLGIIDKSGAWLSVDGERLAQGKANACAVLASNADWLKRIETAVRERME